MYGNCRIVAKQQIVGIVAVGMVIVGMVTCTRLIVGFINRLIMVNSVLIGLK